MRAVAPQLQRLFAGNAYIYFPEHSIVRTEQFVLPLEGIEVDIFSEELRGEEKELKAVFKKKSRLDLLSSTVLTPKPNTYTVLNVNALPFLVLASFSVGETKIGLKQGPFILPL
ncbi:MAG: hypothetical protein ACP5MH_11840 [Thermoproteus sp.]